MILLPPLMALRRRAIIKTLATVMILALKAAIAVAPAAAIAVVPAAAIAVVPAIVTVVVPVVAMLAPTRRKGITIMKGGVMIAEKRLTLNCRATPPTGRTMAATTRTAPILHPTFKEQATAEVDVDVDADADPITPTGREIFLLVLIPLLVAAILNPSGGQTNRTEKRAANFLYVPREKSAPVDSTC